MRYWKKMFMVTWLCAALVLFGFGAFVVGVIVSLQAIFGHPIDFQWWGAAGILGMSVIGGLLLAYMDSKTLW